MTKREFVNIMQEKFGTPEKREAWVAKVQATGWQDYHFAEEVLLETFLRIVESGWYRKWSEKKFSFHTIRRFIRNTARELNREHLEDDGADVRWITSAEGKRQREMIPIKTNWDFRTPEREDHDALDRSSDDARLAERYFAARWWASECQARYTNEHEPRPLPPLEQCLPFFGATEREVLLKLFEEPPTSLEDIARQYPSRFPAFWRQWWAIAQTLLGVARKCRDWTFTQDEAQFARQCANALTWPTQERQSASSPERLHKQFVVRHLLRAVDMWPAMADSLPLRGKRKTYLAVPPTYPWAEWLFTKAPQDVKARRLRFLDMVMNLLAKGVPPIPASLSR